MSTATAATASGTAAGPLAVTGLADDLQALYTRAKDEVGEADLAHIRRVTAYGRAIDARRRELLREGGPRSVRRAALLETLYRLLQFSELGHNIIHGCYDHLPDNGEYHSGRYRWDFNVDVDHWKTMHHAGHHPNTNIVGKDHDLGYSLLRGQHGQEWYGHHLGQVAIISALAACAPQAAPFFLSNVARRVDGHRFLSAYTLRAPAAIAARDALERYVRGPREAGARRALPALLANYLGGVGGYMAVLFLVFIEHHAGELELFADPGPEETADQYYERQIRATRNFLPSPELDAYIERVLAEEVPFEDRPDVRIFYGGLDTHVEHHLFPDLPPSMQRRIAPEVRRIARRHGLPYHETPLLDTVPLIARTLTALSAPIGERERGRPWRLLARPGELGRRLAHGLAYRTLPESPYFAKPRFHDVPARVVSATPVAGGQALSVRIARPRGWGGVRWEAGAYLSVRVEVDGEDLVRQYSVVHEGRPTGVPDAEADGTDADAMEICIKRVDGGRVSHRLNDTLQAGRYLTLVGPPTSSGDFAMDTPPARSLFVAGGVGITPIIALLRRLTREAPGSDAVVVYANRDEDSVIFEAELRDLAARAGVRLHLYTDSAATREGFTTGRLSAEVLRQLVPDAAERETYVCAPPALIDGTREWLRAMGQPEARFHAESFSPPEVERPVDDGSRYTIRFRRSGTRVEVDGATTLLEAANQAGLRVPTGCERGLCRTCVTPKLEGTTHWESDGPELDRVTVCNSMATSDIDLDL